MSALEAVLNEGAAKDYLLYDIRDCDGGFEPQVTVLMAQADQFPEYTLAEDEEEEDAVEEEEADEELSDTDAGLEELGICHACGRSKPPALD